MTLDFSSIVSLVVGFIAIWQAWRYNVSTNSMLIEQRAILKKSKVTSSEIKENLEKITDLYEAVKNEINRLENVKIDINEARKVALSTVFSI